MFDAFVTDLRYASRALRQSPGFTLVGVLTLALGIGLNLTVFTVTNAILFKPFPFVAGGDRILYVERPGVAFSDADVEPWRARAKAFEGIAAATAWLATLSDPGGVPERCAVTVISANGFALIGQRPVLGRDFRASDAVAGAAPVAILSDALWERRYGRDPDIIGRTLRLEVSAGVPVLPQGVATVIGVMAPGFSFPLDQDLWVPRVSPATVPAQNTRNITFLFGRMSDEADIEGARAELETLGRELQRSDAAAGQRPVSVQSFSEHFVGTRATRALTLMAGAVSFVLLIACANVANLLLARAITRSKDISVRIALGAGRGRIVRQVLTESVLLAAMAGVLGWGIATLGVRAYELSGYAPFNYRHYVDFAMDGRVLVYLVAISAATGLLFGLAPVSRLWKLDTHAVLKDTSRSMAGGRRTRHLSMLLVSAEMGLAVVLLAGAGVMIRSVLHVYTAPLGVDAERLLMSDLGLPSARYADAASQVAFHDRLAERLEAVPGVESVAIADRYPTQGTRRVPFALDGDAPVDDLHRPTVSVLVVGPGYFGTMGAMVLAGREFTRDDVASGAPAVLVNQQFASRSWPGATPLGRRVRLLDGRGRETWRTVVGVVSDVVQNDRRESAPQVYLSYGQSPTAFMYVFVRGQVSTEGLGPGLRRALQSLDPMLPSAFQALTERLDRNARDAGLFSALLAVFAAVGLVLASVGLYAVVAYIVSQRTQEIGIRTAMGATARDIGLLVLRQGMRPVAVGLPIGVAASLAVNRVLESQLVDVAPFDPLTLVVTSAMLCVSAGLGCVLPARRAMRVDPIVALRHEQ